MDRYGFNSARRVFTRGRPAYGLIEVLIVLVILGVLLKNPLSNFASSVDDARLKAVVSQVENIRTAVMMFQERYGQWPGDVENAAEVFGEGVPSGNGNGIIEGEGLGAPNASEAAAFWVHLIHARLMEDTGKVSVDRPITFGKGAPSVGINGGGGITVVHNPNGWPGHWLCVGAKRGATGEGGLLTPEQAHHLLTIMGHTDGTAGAVRVANGRGTDRCLRAGRLDRHVKEKACVVYVQLNDG